VSIQPEPVTALLRPDLVARPLEGDDARTPPLEIVCRAADASSLVAAFVRAARDAAGGESNVAPLRAAAPVFGPPFRPPAVPIGPSAHLRSGPSVHEV
jgi:hypothetical protein